MTQSAEQKVQGLIAPRIKVIAPYPDSPFEVGEILLLGKYKEYGYYWTMPDNSIMYFDDNKRKSFMNYPAIFQKLEWWQEREINDMPEYVKLINTKPSYQLLNGCIRLVTEWNKDIHDTWICDTFPVYIHVSNLEPATKEEHDNYIQSKK